LEKKRADDVMIAPTGKQGKKKKKTKKKKQQKESKRPKQWGLFCSFVQYS
jgi:hypothetical protein